MSTTELQTNKNRVGSPSAGSTGTGRIVSIDALRGFDMFWLMRGYGVFLAGAALISPEVGSAVSAQFDHSAWTGFTFWDFIAPLFLFVVGLS
ncbi:MAG: DUF5009 domain-containing protein, partial [Bryobacteraceae bacterium]